MLKRPFAKSDWLDAVLVVLWVGIAFVPALALQRGEPDRYPNENSGMLILCAVGLLLSVSSLVATRTARYLCLILAAGIMAVGIRQIVSA
jgi:hypothetical protein